MKFIYVPLFLLILGACTAPVEKTSKIRSAFPDIPLTTLIKKEQVTGFDILIDKSDCTLSLTSQNKVIKTYPIVLGPNPVDDKLMEGDGCTPEGTFKIRTQYPHKSWSKFIWVDFQMRNR